MCRVLFLSLVLCKFIDFLTYLFMQQLFIGSNDHYLLDYLNKNCTFKGLTTFLLHSYNNHTTKRCYSTTWRSSSVYMFCGVGWKCQHWCTVGSHGKCYNTFKHKSLYGHKWFLWWIHTTKQHTDNHLSEEGTCWTISVCTWSKWWCYDE